MLFNIYYRWRKALIAFTVLLAGAALFSIPYIKVVFNFEQFFPTGDEDLEFFQEFIEEFETDDNFLLIALERHPTVFDQAFITRVNAFSDSCKTIPHIISVQSLPQLKIPRITPLGPVLTDLSASEKTQQLLRDSSEILKDERLVYNLINEKGTALVVALKTVDGIQMEESKVIIDAVKSELNEFGFTDYHILGRAYFQTELSRLQIREIFLSTLISALLISIIMVLIFRRWRTILIALSSIGLALGIFMGLLSILGRELTVMAALYPILMLIVGTSDVVHIMTKYMDELVRGNERKKALEITIRQIGLATLMTSLTTAVGFATLLSSRILPIREFGVNAALGVLVAYIVMLVFTCPLMSLFDKEKITHVTQSRFNWNSFLVWCYEKSKTKAVTISICFAAFIILSAIGISRIHMNYELEKNLPKNTKVSEDFSFFEKEFAGFRPLEIAVFLQPGYDIYDYPVVSSIARTENYIRSKKEIQTSASLATLAKSINKAIQFGNTDAYAMPDSSAYASIKPFLIQMKTPELNALISADQRKTRISARIKDVGAENIKDLSDDIDRWIDQNIDASVVEMKQTGTGLILDKNSRFVRESLLKGLGLAIVIVSILMGLLFRRLKYLFISIVPNLVPLVFAAALIGYGGIPLESGTSIVFAIIFGIAVDDTIHFMGKYKLALDMYGDREKALLITFTETGKAIIYTSIILFFGFLIMLFSKTEPSVIIGMLISVTLVSAVVADLLLLPVIIRWADRQ